MKKIAILASGSGSNAENIANYFANSDYAKVSVIALGFSNSIFKISNLKEKGIL